MVLGENEDGLQTQDTRGNKILNTKRTRVNGRDGAPALVHRPAVTAAAPSPEKGKMRGVLPHG